MRSTSAVLLYSPPDGQVDPDRVRELFCGYTVDRVGRATIQVSILQPPFPFLHLRNPDLRQVERTVAEIEAPVCCEDSPDTRVNRTEASGEMVLQLTLRRCACNCLLAK